MGLHDDAQLKSLLDELGMLKGLEGADQVVHSIQDRVMKVTVAQTQSCGQ